MANDTPKPKAAHSVENDLKSETEKWAVRIEKDIKGVRLGEPENPSSRRLFENIHAYIKDSRYFTEKGDSIRAFEAIIWAWSWLEILKEMGTLKCRQHKE